MTNAAPTVDEVLMKLNAERDELAIRRTQAQQEVDAYVARMNVLARRYSAIQVATTKLAGLAPLPPVQKWRDHLIAWRKTLRDELLALPATILDAHTLGLQKNLTLSVRVIDVGREVVNGTGYDLTTLRLGELMREAGYEVSGADPVRHRVGELPWHGSLARTERRIADLLKQRDDAQAQLNDALLDDGEAFTPLDATHGG